MEPDATGENEAWPVPADAYRISLPKDKELLSVYGVHKPAVQSLTLKSEKGRTVFAEAFIENHRLGTLAELCTSVLAREFGAMFTPMVAKDLKTMRLFYDAIDIESPLEKIFRIEDYRFWKRLVLAKTTDRSIQFKDDNFDWKSLGISLKYTQLVEECPAEFWPEKKMEALAVLVKENVKELHIKKLQPLQDYMFARYLLRDSDTDKSDSTDVSSSTAEERDSDEAGVDESEGEEEQQATSRAADKIKSESKESKESEELSEGVAEEYGRLQFLQAEWNSFAAKRTAERQKVLEERKAARRARREAQQERRERREAKLQERREKELMLTSKKPKRIIVRNIYDLPVEEEKDLEGKLVDKRNLENVLKQRKLYDYPPQHCHHVDLRFVRLFENLEELSIVFHPPALGAKFHSRYFKFSYGDVERLASGISGLESLRIFRLRKSRMDERKLRMLTTVLKFMNVEVIDIGYDYLGDDCDGAIWELFQNTTNTIKSLELEGNYFNTNVLRSLAFALRRYEGHLEYLGLARNPLNYEALHTLCKLLPYMEQIEHLNLTGIKMAQYTLNCCVSDELLRRHKALRKLDLIAIPIGAKAAEDIIKALDSNLTIEHVDCRGCGLPFEIECEIEVCLNRNRYLVDNPYIGDNARTEEEIKDFCGRQKNAVMNKVMEALELKKACLENRPDIAERYTLTSEKSVSNEQTEQLEGSLSSESVAGKPFVYNANEFNLEQIQRQVHVPGPGQRYYYFRRIRK